MKKTFFLIGLLSLTACSQGVTDSTKMVDESFNKKLECAKYITQSEKRVEEYGREIAGEKGASWPNMEKVFYSLKANSCLYLWSNNMVNGLNNRIDRGLNDALSGEELVREIYIKDDASLGNEPEMLERFSAKIKPFIE